MIVDFTDPHFVLFMLAVVALVLQKNRERKWRGKDR